MSKIIDLAKKLKSLSERDIDIFIEAFIYKNNIIPSDPDDLKLENLKPEEIKRLKKVIGMMIPIEKSDLRKQIDFNNYKK